MFQRFKKQDPVPEPKAPREFFRACNIYCRAETEQVIVAAVFNHGGLIAEKPAGAIVVKFSDPEAIHHAVVEALGACEYEETFNYSKKNDWPAYQVSGCKTLKKFEAEFVRLSVRGVNEKNFFYGVTAPQFGEYGLHLAISVNAHTGHFGEAVRYLVKHFLTCNTGVSETFE